MTDFCHQCEELLLDYPSLDHAQRQRVDAHLACCPACRANHQEMQEMHDLFHESMPADTPTDFADAILAAITPAAEAPRRRPVIPVLAALLAVEVMILLLPHLGLAAMWNHLAMAWTQAASWLQSLVPEAPIASLEAVAIPEITTILLLAAGATAALIIHAIVRHVNRRETEHA